MTRFADVDRARESVPPAALECADKGELERRVRAAEDESRGYESEIQVLTGRRARLVKDTDKLRSDLSRLQAEKGKLKAEADLELRLMQEHSEQLDAVGRKHGVRGPAGQSYTEVCTTPFYATTRPAQPLVTPAHRADPVNCSTPLRGS